MNAATANTTKKRNRKTAPRLPEQVGHLFDLIIKTFDLKNDAALCRMLQVPPPSISKARRGWINLSADMIIRIHEATGWAIADIKKRIGLPSLA